MGKKAHGSDDSDAGDEGGDDKKQVGARVDRKAWAMLLELPKLAKGRWKDRNKSQLIEQAIKFAVEREHPRGKELE